jgi:nucleoside-diphosphate-sugar epimerase
MKNVLITGGCGFLGQHLTNKLLRKYPKVQIKILDLYDNPKPLFNFKKNKRVSYVLGKNICNFDKIEKALS